MRYIILMMLLSLGFISSAQMYQVTTNNFKTKSFTQKQAKKQLVKLMSDTTVFEVDIVVNYNQDKSIRIWKNYDDLTTCTCSLIGSTILIDSAITVVTTHIDMKYSSLTIKYLNWNTTKNKVVYVTNKTNWLRIADKAFDPDGNCAVMHIYSDTTYLYTAIFDEEYLWSVNAKKEPWGGVQIQSPAHYLASQLYIKASFRN